MTMTAMQACAAIGAADLKPFYVRVGDREFTDVRGVSKGAVQIAFRSECADDQQPVVYTPTEWFARLDRIADNNRYYARADLIQYAANDVADWINR